MKIKAKDMCPRCKYCLDMTPQGTYSCGKANDGSELNIGVNVVLNCANFEWKDGKVEGKASAICPNCKYYEEEINMSNLKVEGKVSDICPNCKNCKGVTNEYDGKTASIRLTEVECEDPYDGMTKTLTADSDVCCSMFEPKPACEKCERFDGTYCHSPEGIFVTSYMAMSGDYVTGNCPSYVEKKEKEPCDKISCLQHELEMDKLRMKIHQLEKEKVAHMKGIERLKKSQEKLQNQVKNLQTTNEESYKREEKLEDKVHKLERRLLEENKRFDRLDTEFLIPLSRVLYPREAKICKPYSEVLKDIKEMSNYENELISLNTINKGLAEDRKKLINYIRSLKIASENYLKEFTYEED